MCICQPNPQRADHSKDLAGDAGKLHWDPWTYHQDYHRVAHVIICNLMLYPPSSSAGRSASVALDANVVDTDSLQPFGEGPQGKATHSLHPCPSPSRLVTHGVQLVAEVSLLGGEVSP